jgi:rRNA processing protein Gar1
VVGAVARVVGPVASVVGVVADEDMVDADQIYASSVVVAMKLLTPVV